MCHRHAKVKNAHLRGMGTKDLLRHLLGRPLPMDLSYDELKTDKIHKL